MRKLLHIAYLILLSLTGYAQDKPYIQFTVDNGLPSDNILDIIESDDGYIWLATDNGISRFDGSKFINYSKKDGLPSNEIWLLHKDTLGRIWLLNSVNSGVYIQDNKIESIEIAQSKPYSPTSLLFHPSGIGFRRANGIDMVFGQELHSFSFDTTPKPTPPDIFDKMYFANVSLTSFSIIEKYLSHVRKTNDRIAEILSEAHDNTDYHYYLNNGENLIRIPLGELKINHILNDEIVFDTSLYQNISVHLPKVNGKVLHIDHSSGYLQYDINQKTIIADKKYPDEIKLNRTIVKDHLLYSASRNGLLCRNKFLTRVKSNLDFTTDVCISDGHLYQVINNNTLVSSHPQTTTIDTIVHNSSSAILLEKQNQVCYAFHSNTFYNLADHEAIQETVIRRSDIASMEGMSIDEFNEKNIFNSILSLHIDDSLILKSNRFSLFKVITANRRPVVEHRIKRNIQAIEFYKNKWYFGRNSGISICDSINSNCRDIAFMDGLSVISFIEHADKLYAVTRRKGIIDLIDQKSLGKRSSTDIIHQCIKTDSLLIYDTDEHLVKVNLNTGSISRFAYGGFFPHLSIKKIIIDEGNLFILTHNGSIYKISLDHLTLPKCDPEISYNIDDEHIHSFEDHGLIMNDGSFAITCDLHGVSSFGNNIYRYRLTPGDTTWIETTDTIIQLLEVAPGKYQFEIQGFDAYMNSTPIKTAQFIVLKKWYKTVWFYVICALLAIGFIGFMSYGRNVLIQRREKEKTALNKRFAELEMNALRAQMNPHFIFNSLAAIQSYIRQSKKEEADDYLAQFALLIRTFLDQSRSKTVRIDDELALLKNYVNLENLRFGNTIEFKINIDRMIDTYESIPSLLLQPFIENAINHGLFYKEGHKQLILDLDQDEHSLIITISDNGVGRKASKELNKKSKPLHKSRGTTIIEERISTINAAGDYLISYEVEDLNPTLNTGTRVTIRIQYR